jgi:hypothetical protein
LPPLEVPAARHGSAIETVDSCRRRVDALARLCFPLIC